MRKHLTFLILLFVLLVAGGALAEGPAEKVTYYRVSFSSDAEYINMDSQRIVDWDEFYCFLSQFPNLKKVDMFATDVYRTRINEIKAQFPDIEFGWTIRISEHSVRTDQTAFSTLHNNKSQPHYSADFSVLRYCTKLLALDIGHNLVEDVSFLHYLPQLRVLILACNINLTDITPLRELIHLEYLELFKNNIHDISPLAGLTELRDLNICFNRITNYEPLKGLYKLERLWLFNSNNYSDDIPVPYSTVSMLRNALPYCHVDSTSYSTLGGWREHIRYDIINKMFDEGYYIAFSFSPPVNEMTYVFSGGKTVELGVPQKDDGLPWEGEEPAGPMPDPDADTPAASYTFTFSPGKDQNGTT